MSLLSAATIAVLLLPHALGAQLPHQDYDSTATSIASAVRASPTNRFRIHVRGFSITNDGIIQVMRDSLRLMQNDSVSSYAISAVDSLWVQKRDLGKWFALGAGVPCAILGAFFGHFVETDPDSGHPPRPVRGILIGGAVGGAICALPAAGVGSLFHRWKLVYAAK